jgi:hypothetical protein
MNINPYFGSGNQLTKRGNIALPNARKTEIEKDGEQVLRALMPEVKRVGSRETFALERGARR